MSIATGVGEVFYQNKTGEWIEVGPCSFNHPIITPGKKTGIVNICPIKLSCKFNRNNMHRLWNAIAWKSLGRRRRA